MQNKYLARMYASRLGTIFMKLAILGTCFVFISAFLSFVSILSIIYYIFLVIITLGLFLFMDKSDNAFITANLLEKMAPAIAIVSIVSFVLSSLAIVCFAFDHRSKRGKKGLITSIVIAIILGLATFISFAASGGGN